MDLTIPVLIAGGLILAWAWWSTRRAKWTLEDELVVQGSTREEAKQIVAGAQASELTVRCPTCGAPAGTFCRYPPSVDTIAAHPARSRLVAIRRRDPRRIVVTVVVVAGFGIPLFMLVFLMPWLEPRLRSLPGGLLYVAFGSAMVVAGLLHTRRDPALRMRFAWRAPWIGTFLDRHPRLVAVFFVIFGSLIVVTEVPSALDWTATPDVRAVSITRVSVSRGGETIFTTEGTFRSAPLWTPKARSGRATLTIGHLSGLVLDVKQ